MRYRPNVVAAARSAGVPLLILVGKAETSDLTGSFVRMLPRVARFLDVKRGYSGEVALALTLAVFSCPP